MKYTEKLNLKKPDLTDYVNVADLNDNMDALDLEVGELKEGKNKVIDLETIDKTYKGAINEVNAKVESHKAESMQQIAELEKQLANYNSYASLKDENGIFTVVEYKRTDDTTYMKSTLSNPDTNGNYQTCTWEFYDDVGTTVLYPITWQITYDGDGGVISEVIL